MIIATDKPVFTFQYGATNIIKSMNIKEVIKEFTFQYGATNNFNTE